MLAALNLPLPERRAEAAALRGRRTAIAGVANMVLTARYPAWCGPAGADDAAHALDAARHVDFLAGALETGESKPFTDYVGWMKTMLTARQVSPHLVAESLGLIRHGALASAGLGGRAAIDQLLRAGVARANAPEPPVNDNRPTDLATEDAAFLSAILSGDRRRAVAVAREALHASAHPTDVYVNLFQRSLEEIGVRWQANQISVAQEHLATTTVQFVLAQLYTAVDRSAPRRGCALVTGVEGELHQVGANLVADVLEADGWDVRFLGADVPHDGIVEAALEMKADLIGVSATMLFNVDAVGRLLESLRRAPRLVKPRILVGGGAFRSAPKLWREVGADDFAVDLRNVCAAARGEDHRARH